MNRKSGSNHSEILATSNQNHSLKKQPAAQKISLEKGSNGAVTFAQLVSKSSPSDGANNDSKLKSSAPKTKNSLNKDDSNSVVLPSVKLEPAPRILFGNWENTKISGSTPKTSGSPSDAISGGIPQILPKVRVKPVFGNSKSSEIPRNRSNSGASGIGPVPLPSRGFSDKDSQPKQLNTPFPDPNILSKEARDPKLNTNRNINKIPSQYPNHLNNPKPNRPQIPSGDDSYRRMGSSSVNQNTQSHQSYSNDAHNNIVNSGVNAQSPYMTNTAPLSSVPDNSTSNISANPGGFHIQNQGIEQHQYNNYSTIQGSQHNMGPRIQSGGNIPPSSPYVQQINRDKQIPVPTNSVPTISSANTINFSIPQSNQTPQNHIPQNIPMVHSAMPNSINNVHQQPMNNINNQMNHWGPAGYYNSGHINPPVYDSQYNNFGSAPIQQHIGFAQPNPYMISRHPPNMPMQQAMLINPSENNPQIVNIQQVSNLNSLPSSPLSVGNKLNAKSSEFTPRTSANRVRITDPNTKKSVDLHTKTYRNLDQSKPSTSLLNIKDNHDAGDDSTPPALKVSNPTDSPSLPLADKKSIFVVPSRTKAIKIINPKLKEAAETKAPETLKSKPTNVSESASATPSAAEKSTPPVSANSSNPSITTQAPKAADANEPTPKPSVDPKEDSAKPSDQVPAISAPSVTVKVDNDSVPQASNDVNKSVDISVDVSATNDVKEIKVEDSSKPPAIKVDSADITKSKSEIDSSEVLTPRSSALSQENIAAETQRIVDELNKEKIGIKETSQPPKASDKPTQIHILTLEEILKLDIYPQSAKECMPELVNGYISYPVQFLTSFKLVCKKSPGFNFDLGPSDDRSSGPSRDNRRGLNRNRSEMGRDRIGARSNNSMLPTEMNVFKPVPRTSEERFQASVGQGNLNAIRSPGGLGSRTSSQGNRNSRMSRQNHGYKSGNQQDDNQSQMQNYEPLPKTENRWKPQIKSTFDDSKISTINASEIPDDVVERKIKVLLNKLTVDNYDKVSPEIIAWANRSVEEPNARIVIIVLNLIFEKAVDEPPFAAMYAKLSRLLHDAIDDNISLDLYLDKDGNPVKGTMVVRKVLLNRCQREFESGWKAEIPDDIKSDEYYKAMKIKRRGLGLVKYVGEMFLLSIISDKLLRGLVIMLLNGVIEDETIESAAKLLTTVGFKVENHKGTEFLDMVCHRLNEIANLPTINSRIKFMLMDVIDLRANKWVSRGKETGPKAISEVHADVERQKSLQSNVLRKNMSSTGRGQGMQNNNRGGYRNGDRNSYAGRSNNRSDNNPNRQAGDLSGFGNLSRSKAYNPTTQVPGSNPFANLSQGSRGWKSSGGDQRNRKDDSRPNRNVPLSNTASSRRMVTPTLSKPKPENISSGNMFNALATDNDESEQPLSPSPESTISAMKAKLVSETTASVNIVAPTLSSDVIKIKAKSIVDEYKSIRDKTEFTECLVELGIENYSNFLSALIEYSLDFKTSDVDLVSDALKHVFKSSIFTKEQIQVGFSSITDALVDISTDVPFAYKHYAILLNAFDVSVIDINQYMGDLVKMIDSRSPPPFEVIRHYLTIRSESIGSDALISEIENSGNNPFDITQYLPLESRDSESVKRTLDLKSLLNFFPNL
ncbi:Eukaryotic translation initiation factor 4 gamma [Smittium culicis]|uniref:Eukaryotic translation initiation factor 4 gamma n=1 Tax=Smittium culicis TaxID=133412 RepID=A0A1R1YSN5_9FUNG|nr:Eukaryotic translation initiation factor 4 gamma [Smittium culicis]